MSLKFKGELCVMTMKNYPKIEEKLTCQFEIYMRKLDGFWSKQSKISKICTIMGCLWPKYIMFELKQYRGVMFDGTEYWCKIWTKTDFCFQKWHEKFGKFSPEHLKVSKLGLWWHPFIQSRKCISLKFTGELFIMTMKKDAKLNNELTCRFKIDSSTLINFYPSFRKSQKFAL